MKFENKLLATLVAASVCMAGSLTADDKEKLDEPAGAEIQVQTNDEGIEADSQLKVDEPAGAESETPEKKFVKKAAQGGMAEVKIGQLAAQKAQSSSVKQFGDKLARDHQEANDKLKKIAEQKGITVDEELKGKHKEKIEELGSLSGAEFDKAFIKSTVEHHEKDIREFEKQATEGEDPAIRSFASETVPTLREHLRIAKQLQENRNASIPELREPAGAQPEGIQPDADQAPAEQPQKEPLQLDDTELEQDDAADAQPSAGSTSNP